MPTVKPSWDPAPIEYSIEAIRDKIRQSLEYKGIPIEVQASVLDRYSEADSETLGDEPQPELRPASVRSSASAFWSHPYIKLREQICTGNLPPEWEKLHMRLPSRRDRKDVLTLLIFSAKLDHLVNRVQRLLSETNLQDRDAGPGEVGPIVKEALHLLSLVDFDDMLCGERQRVTNAQNARQQPQRLAGVIIFYSIIKKEGVERLPEILYYLGAKRYQRIRVYKQQFVLKNNSARKMVELYKVTKAREKLLWSRDYQSSTFYEWRAEALGILKSETEREAWEREQRARDEES